MKGAAITVATLLGPIAVAMADWAALAMLISAFATAVMGWLFVIFVLGHPFADELRSVTQQVWNRGIVAIRRRRV